MSYDIAFRAKVEGTNEYIDVGECSANITWNVRKIITLSTGLEWKNEENNGYCKDVIPCIAKGLAELMAFPEKYKPYESPNGWGTVEGTKHFFMQILKDWEAFCLFKSEELINATTFWIM